VKKEAKVPGEAKQEEKSPHQAQHELKERLKTLLENEALIPRELIFLTRCATSLADALAS
jgi:aarF domain-containing kinase